MAYSQLLVRIAAAGVAVAIAGCVTPPAPVPPIPPSPNPNWIRVSGEEANCVSYGPREREAVDINIILKPEFEGTLVSQLDAAELYGSRCWYETPAGTIRLFAGDFCAGGTEAFFEAQAPVWKLVRSSMVFISCHPSR